MWNDREWPIRLVHRAGASFAVDVLAEGAPVLENPDGIRWTVAYGANACPERLLDKSLDVKGAVLLPAALLGWAPAWEARRSATGAVPVTLVPSPGRRSDVWVLGVHADDLARLDQTEYRGTNYTLGHLGPVAVADRWRLADALAYGPGPDTRVLVAGGDVAAPPAVDQADARALLDQPDPVSVGADPFDTVVEEGWPQTPLEDLPLFAYGTLMPDAPRWDAIADLVQRAGPATVEGRLTATYFGWPAAELDGDGQIHGELLHPADAAAAHELYETCDALEDAPTLFQRRAVPVRLADGGDRWAATYVWNADQGPPPGQVLDDGRWFGQMPG